MIYKSWSQDQLLFYLKSMYNEARILINPVIIKREGLTDYWEACASCLDNFGHVQRPYRIIVQYQDINNRIKTQILNEFINKFKIIKL